MVSVCLATFNGENFIKEQLKSILLQLNENDEIIVSDDHSTDKTIDIINSISDSRIKVYSNIKKPGYTKNFENALEKAEGDIIFLSDQDDIWMENKVVVSLDALKDYDFVVSDAEIANSKLNIIDVSIFEYRKVKQGFIRNFIQIKYLGCCMAFKRNVLNKALPFPNNQKLVTHDSWLTLVAEMFFNVKLINKPLIKYRRHENNTSLGGARGGNTLIRKVLIRLYSLFHLIRILGR